MRLTSALRDPEDAIAGIDGTSSNLIVGEEEGDLAIENVGKGPALNVRFVFEAMGPLGGKGQLKTSGFVPIVGAGERCRLPVAREVLGVLDWQASLKFESASGKEYDAAHEIVNKVIRVIRFCESPRSR